MARTQKNTAAYFPHDADASAGDTLTVLQGRFNNDGYAFWFKLLERLASTDGHYLDLRNPQKWQTFIAKMGITQETTVEIMDLLVEMQAIDEELWCSKVIWCQNLVDNLADVYKNRKRDLPLKPILTEKNGITTLEIGIPTTSNSPPDPLSPHTPLTPLPPKTKVNETILNEKETISSSLSKEDVIEAYKKEIAGLYEEESLSEIIEKDIEATINIFSAAWVIDAIQEAVSRKNRTWRYVTGILKNWKRFGKNYVPGKSDPDKYIKGKYGHMVQR